ncbi:MAG: DUF4058 family protein [Chloroflexi bacterium CFX4]|nr:DUF4058 family protein [Chloroflexi bacterium CFX4]MDL1923952.1 DUF4058 family protein [Chloroflexi bacterium CFX3]
MAVQARHNLYSGVNANLNSLLQNTAGEWESFHATHIVDLTRALNAQLPAGYEARTERSLQIREVAIVEGEEQVRRQRPQPDATIFGVGVASGRSTQLGAPSAALTATILETMDIDSETFLSAVVIYQVQGDARFGTPITRLELLSPANKPRGAGYAQYREKRNATLRGGMPLVEIDYLHQSPPIAKDLASYADQHPNAYPYAVIVSDPRPSLHEGTARLYVFGIDAPIPHVDIPLTFGVYLHAFDLGAVYNITYEQTPTYGRVIDYSVLPSAFERYAPEDQARIQARMATILSGA